MVGEGLSFRFTNESICQAGLNESRNCTACFLLDCVYFVPIDYDSTRAFTRNFLAPRSFDRSCVAKFFRRYDFFFVDAKIFSSARKLGKQKVWTDAINSVQKSSKSEPSSRFLSHLKLENSLATFGRIQPIVPGFIALYPPLWHKSLEDRPNSPKSGL